MKPDTRKILPLLFFFYVLGTCHSDTLKNLPVMTFGVGYPMGIVNKLNDAFDMGKAWSEQAFGNTLSSEKYEKAWGYSINANALWLRKNGNKFENYCGLFGYSFHSTTKASYKNKSTYITPDGGSIDYELDLHGSYYLNEFRAMPAIFFPSLKFVFGGGVQYTHVTYKQKGTTIDNFSPSFEDDSGGFGWVFQCIILPKTLTGPALEAGITPTSFYFGVAISCT